MLPSPAHYAPYLTGKYSVLPGLSQLHGDNAFEADRRRGAYLAAKAEQLAGHPERYYRTQEFPAEFEREAVEFLVHRFDCEWPDLLDGYPTTLDAFARQVQEDVAIVRREGGVGGRDFNAALHVCFPSGWCPGEKVGRSFFETHAPVAGFAAHNARAAKFVDTMIHATGGLVRFVWTLSPDDRLDHHPSAEGRGVWDAGRPGAWVRVERQVILGLPDQEAAAFLIRTYVYDVRELEGEEREALATALETMPPESVAYKGLGAWGAEAGAWMRGLG